MTRKLFWDDPYLTVLETQVEAVNGGEVGLRETIFFAFSGGQESDAGMIGGYPVLAAEIRGHDIRYRLPEDHQLQPGDLIEVRIDWERRYRLMRLHFAAELILELVYRALPGVQKIGAHIAADKARIDFLWSENLTPLFPRLIAQAAELIGQDGAIISAFVAESGQRRYWELPGFARVSCGGTHLRHAGEVGEITLKRKNVGQGKERIEIHLDARPPAPATLSSK